MNAVPPTRYIRPGRGTLIFNKVVAWLTRAGLSVMGSRELRVLGAVAGSGGPRRSIC